MKFIGVICGCWTKNRGVFSRPNHPFVHRVFHERHHPFWGKIWGFSPYFWGNAHIVPYCWWKKSCTTWDGAKTLKIMRYLPYQLVNAGFLPSTVFITGILGPLCSASICVCRWCWMGYDLRWLSSDSYAGGGCPRDVGVSNEKRAPSCLGSIGDINYPVMWWLLWAIIRIPIKQPV